RPAPTGAADPTVILAVAPDPELATAAHWGPITDSMYDFHRRWDELRDLKPAVPTASHRGAEFQPLLPPGPVAAGDIWPLPAAAPLPFLRQFHPGATSDMHINNGDSPGAYACLRAVGDRHAEMVFRIHAEFVLRDGFFTPAQFAGTLVVDRTTD